MYVGIFASRRWTTDTTSLPARMCGGHDPLVDRHQRRRRLWEGKGRILSKLWRVAGQEAQPGALRMRRHSAVRVAFVGGRWAGVSCRLLRWHAPRNRSRAMTTSSTPKASSPSNIEVAQQAKMRPIVQIARDRLGIPEAQLEPYGRYKAKVSLDYVRQLGDRPDGKLVLVTAISPTPAGEGKTTTTVGLGDALNHIGRKAIICLRAPALGPVFGIKGGAAGGGYSQVVPMEDINLHFTGDFAAIALANNLLAALIDNHIHQGNQLGFDVRRITWRRVVDCNDRALRDIVISLGGTANGYPREDGFDIVVASEVMAIFCMANSLADLKERLGKIVVGYTVDQKPILARDLKAHGAMTVL